MQENEIKDLLSNGIFEQKPLKGQLEETHISWVILTNKHAFKIKKPVKLSFLDFSTLELRKYFCDREVVLNSRFCDIYEKVVPLTLKDGRWYIDGEGEVVDYAVKMQRLRSDKRMDKLLKENKVSEQDIKSLAKSISSFHTDAQQIYTPFDLGAAEETFNEIEGIRALVDDQLGASWGTLIEASISWSNEFLGKHAARLAERTALGFKRDVHGDLHSGNIFLYDKPILFDCIEFNDAFRQIDLLYEVAFICMDLEAQDQKYFSDLLLSEYRRQTPCIETKEDENIFVYFKCLRANIRAKVHAIRANELNDSAKFGQEIEEVRKYLHLVKRAIT